MFNFLVASSQRLAATQETQFRPSVRPSVRPSSVRDHSLKSNESA